MLDSPSIHLSPIQTSSPTDALESILQLWLLPMQLGFNWMAMGIVASTGAQSPLFARTGHPPLSPQSIARAAEEEAAKIDEGPVAVIVTPAIVIA